MKGTCRTAPCSNPSWWRGLRYHMRHPNNVLRHCEGVVQHSQQERGWGTDGKEACSRAGQGQMVPVVQVSCCPHRCFDCSPENWRNDVKVKNKWNMFFVGGNLGCWVHARSHFSIYKEHCEAAGIKLHHHTLPQKLFRAMKVEEAARGKQEAKQQSTLDKVLVKAKTKEFSRNDLLHKVAKFIACDDQVCPVTFWMCALNLIDLIHSVARHLQLQIRQASGTALWRWDPRQWKPTCWETMMSRFISTNSSLLGSRNWSNRSRYVFEPFKLESNIEWVVGSTGEGVDHGRWLVGWYDKARLPRFDSALDRCDKSK